MILLDIICKVSDSKCEYHVIYQELLVTETNVTVKLVNVVAGDETVCVISLPR